MIVLLGNGNDPHNQAIINELKIINAKFIILETITLDDRITVTFSNGDMNSIINLSNETILTNNITSIWNYSPLKISSIQNLKKETLDFSFGEWSEAISSLWHSTDSKWINHPDAIRNSSNRIKQLTYAHKIGLHTPKSIITNDPNSLLEFYNECGGNIIAKTLHGSQGTIKGKKILTNKIIYKDIIDSEDLYYVPCLFQEYVPKKTEFRVTIIDKKVYVAEIYSQNSNKTFFDWRNYDDFNKTPYIQSKLPFDITNKLLILMDMMNLKFGCADLIKTPSDEIYFLEVNTKGKWLWIEELTGMKISKEIANYLNSK
jgi:glutathione synthase/RimK-type ligase-like ATP-grasp enzyme